MSVHHIFRAIRRKTNGMSWQVALLLLLRSCTESFPIAAFSYWIQNDLRMSPATQSIFYATIFLPWTSFKPLFAWISDHFPIAGRRRRWYIVGSSIVSAATYLIAGTLVQSVAGAFAISLVRTTANAFAHLMVYLVLNDLAAKNAASAGAIQSTAHGIESVASLVVMCLALVLYPCVSHLAQAGGVFSPRLIISVNAVFPLLCALIALRLPEARVDQLSLQPAGASGGDDGDRGGADGAGDGSDGEVDVVGDDNDDDDALTSQLESVPILSSSDAHDKALPKDGASLVATFPTFELLIPAVVLFLSWASLRTILVHDTWMTMLYIILAIDAAIVGAVVALRCGKPVAFTVGDLAGLWPALVLFLLTAPPTASTQISEFYVETFANSPCHLQTIFIVSSVGSTVASLASFRLFDGRSSRAMVYWLAGTTLVAAAVDLVYWPLFTDHSLATSSSSFVFGYALFATIVSSVVSQVAVIAALTVAVQACPVTPGSGFLYTAYLSCYAMGDSVSGWITAPLVRTVGITYQDFSGMNDLLLISTFAKAAVVIAVPLLFLARKSN